MTAQEWITKGREKSKQGDLKGALEDYEKARKADPNNPWAWNNIGWIYFKLKDFQQALKSIKKAAEINPEESRFWINLEKVYEAMKDPQSALEWYEMAIKADPNNSWAWNNAGMTYLNLKDFQQAIKHLTKATEINPKEVQFWINLGIVYEAMEDPQSVLECYEKARNTDIVNWRGWYLSGFQHYKLKMMDEAFSYMAKAVNLNPKHQIMRNAFKKLWAQRPKGDSHKNPLPFMNPTLDMLDLHHGNIASFDEIFGLNDFQYTLWFLSLNYNNIKAIKDLDKLTWLSALHLDNNQISKIEGLEKLLKLRDLQLSHNQIERIEGLDQLYLLKILHLSNNKIRIIEGLDKLEALETLHLDGNLISKIEGLDSSTNLKELYLQQNQITKIEGLENLRNLEKLDLSYNNITRIEGFDNLNKLRELNLIGNQISRMEGLQALTNLETLKLEKNNLPEAILKLPIKDLVKLCGEVSPEEFEKIAIEIQEQKRRERRIRERTDPSIRVSPVPPQSLLTSIPQRMDALLAYDVPDRCLYCRASVLTGHSQEDACKKGLWKLISAANGRIPTVAEGNLKARYMEDYRELQKDWFTQEWWRVSGQRMKEEVVKEEVGWFFDEDFPPLKGTLCTNCAKEFLIGAEKCFKEVKAYKKKSQIHSSMKVCFAAYWGLMTEWLNKVEVTENVAVQSVCPKCGAVPLENAKFCMKCGTSLKKE